MSKTTVPTAATAEVAHGLSGKIEINDRWVIDPSRAATIAARFGSTLEESKLDPDDQETAIYEIRLPFEDSTWGRIDVTYADPESGWTCDPYFTDELFLTPAQMRTISATMITAATMAEELNEAAI